MQICNVINWLSILQLVKPPLCLTTSLEYDCQKYQTWVCLELLDVMYALDEPSWNWSITTIVFSSITPKKICVYTMSTVWADSRLEPGYGDCTHGAAFLLYSGNGGDKMRVHFRPEEGAECIEAPKMFIAQYLWWSYLIGSIQALPVTWLSNGRQRKLVPAQTAVCARKKYT